MARILNGKRFLIALLSAVSASALGAQTQGEYDSVLRTVDSLVSFQDADLSAEYLIEKRDPGGAISTTQAVMFRRDRADQFLILIMEPVIDKGKGYLRQGETLWLYDPADRSFTFTNARDRFQNSSIRISDFNRSSYSSDYRATFGSKEKLGAFNCLVLTLVAQNNRASYPKMRVWISDDNLIRKTEDYSLSGQLMRTTAIPTYQTVGSRRIPANMVIFDHLHSKKIGGKLETERTSVTISKPSLKTLPDSTYTK
jgi:outer membrane lipoprotein-sorting protein